VQGVGARWPCRRKRVKKRAHSQGPPQKSLIIVVYQRWGWQSGWNRVSRDGGGEVKKPEESAFVKV